MIIVTKVGPYLIYKEKFTTQIETTVGMHNAVLGNDLEDDAYFC